MPISEGNWKMGTTNSVVSDKVASWYKGNWDAETNNYYGGFCIAESIYHKDDAKILAASKIMLETLYRIVASSDEHPYIQNQARLAIQKATE